MIRSQNDQWAARGIELHEKRLERRKQEQASGMSLEQELAEIAKISPELAEAYAKDKGVAWPPPSPNVIQFSGLEKTEDVNVD